MKDIGALFDLDGVLIDSEDEYTRVWSKVHEIYPTGIDNFPKLIKGMTLDNIIGTYYKPSGRDKEIRDKLHELESQMTYHWLPGAKEFIEWLIQENIPTALVTSSDEEKMAHLRQQLPELEQMMTAIVTADKINRSKPDPEGYLLAAQLLKITPERCAVFEDSMQGVKAGKASGAYVIGVSGTLPADVIRPFCNIVVSNLGQIDKNNFLSTLTHSDKC